MDKTDPDEAITTALGERMAAIRADPNTERAYRAAGNLWRTMQDGTTQVAALRAEMAMRLREERQWNLAELARHLGVSPQRMRQLAAKTREQEHEELPGNHGTE